MRKQLFDKIFKRLGDLEAEKPAAPFIPQPYQPRDPLDRVAIPNSAAAEMIAAVPDVIMRDIVADAYRSRQASSIIPPQERAPEQNKGSGWQDEKPISSPAGIKIIDRMLDAADVRDAANALGAAQYRARKG